MTPWGQMTVTIDICVQNDPESLNRTALSDLYVIVTFCDITLTLTFLRIAESYSCGILRGHLSSTLADCELFASRLTDRKAQNVKKRQFGLRSDLDLPHDPQTHDGDPPNFSLIFLYFELSLLEKHIGSQVICFQ